MLTERQGCALLLQVFAARGYALARDVRFDEDGLCFDIDGWDAAARVGFEYRTHEAGDHKDLTDAELAVLAARIDTGDLAVFVIDDTAVEDEDELRRYAHQFLDAVAQRRADGRPPRGRAGGTTKKAAAKKKAATKKKPSTPAGQAELFTATSSTPATAPTTPEDAAWAWCDGAVRGLAPLPGAVSGDDVVTRTRAFARPVWARLADELRGVRGERVTASLLSSAWGR